MRLINRINFGPKQCIKYLIYSLLVAVIAQLYLNLWKNLGMIDVNALSAGIIRALFHCNPLFILCVVFFSYAILCMEEGFKAKIADWIYRWRYLLGAILLMIGVVLNINGSSVHCWGNFIPSQNNGVLMGMARAWRSDEFAVNTPFAFSQASSGFNYYSPVIRAGGDAFITYGQPVWDIAVIFRPSHWGYLLLGAERGLSFFWNARLILLILSSFDMGMLFLSGKRRLALLFSLMIAFSPFVQWWFAINGLVEMLIFGFYAILAFNAYLRTSDYYKRAGYGIIIAWLGCSYVLTFYPAWIVPVAYVMLVLVMWTVFENKSCFTVSWKDAMIGLGTVALICVGLGYVFLKSKETIQLTLNTVYPGQRTGSWPVPLLALFLYPNGLFSPLVSVSTGVYGNPVDSSSLISFFPIGLVLFCINLFKQRKADFVSTGLMLISLFFAIYCTTNFPPILNTLTLMRFTTSHRVLPILMLAQLMLLFRGMAVADRCISIWRSVLVSVLVTVVVILAGNMVMQGYYTVPMNLVWGTLLFGVCLIALQIGENPGLKKALTFAVVFMTLLGGVLVNPVQVGARELTDNLATQLVKPVVENNPDAIWVVDSCYPYNNAIISVGARTLNSTNVYPNMELWHRIDTDGTNEDIYNRYAHIAVDVTSEDCYFEPGIAADQFLVHLNPEALVNLNVSYILTSRDLEQYSTETNRLVLIGANEAYKVYEVQKADSGR